jgi:hypothetical protein
MFKAEHFRTKLAENAELIKNTDAPSEIRKLEQSIKSFRHLAQNEDWLADNFDKMIHSRDLPSKDESEAKPLDGEAVAKIEEHILRCLGAAVMMHWSTIPTKLQRELFDTAGSLGDVLQTVTLRGQVARFLHSHKDEGMPPVGVSKPGIDEKKYLMNAQVQSTSEGDVFARVKRQLQARSPKVVAPRVTTGPILLTGLAVCAAAAE